MTTITTASHQQYHYMKIKEQAFLEASTLLALCLSHLQSTILVLVYSCVLNLHLGRTFGVLFSSVSFACFGICFGHELTTFFNGNVHALCGPVVLGKCGSIKEKQIDKAHIFLHLKAKHKVGEEAWNEANRPAFEFRIQKMPQGCRSSIGCRSFFTCNDAKGVADEFMTVRISRDGSKKRDQDKDRDQRKHKDLYTLFAEERVVTGDARIKNRLDCLNSLTLQQVPVESRELNRSLSWSNGSPCATQPGDMVKDLLKGAQNLGESSVVSRRLQETSSAAPGFSKKHEQKLERRGFDDNGDEKCKLRVERPNHYADGSSNSSIEELNKVIRDGVARQSMAPREEPFDWVRIDSSPSNMVSTSSSHTSATNSSSITSFDSSLSSTASQKRSEQSSLIAKLMGLESLPSSPRRQIRSMKMLNLKRPLFDVDLPILRQRQSAWDRADDKDETINGIVEGMRWKGLLKGSAIDGVNLSSASHDATLLDDNLPIVIIKPLPFSKTPDEGASVGKALTKPRLTRDPARETAICESSKSKHNCEEIPVSSIQIKSRYHGICGKQRREKTEGTETMTKEKGGFNMKKLAVGWQDEVAKKQVAEKMENEVQKEVGATNKRVKRKYVKPEKGVPEVENLKTEYLKYARNGISTHQSGKPEVVSRCRGESTHCGSNNLKSTRQGRGKMVMKRAAAYTVSDDVDAYASDITSIAVRDGTGASDEDFRNVLNGTVPEAAAQNEDGLNSAVEVEIRATAADHLIPMDDCNAVAKLKALLLSNPSYLNRARELFDLKVDMNLVPPADTNLSTSTSRRTLVECANELLELKVQQCAQVHLPLLHHSSMVRLKNTMSLDQVLDETCDVIEALRRYPNPSIQIISADALTMVIGQDLKYAGTRDGMWDIGWRNTCPVDEVERIVCQVEELVLGGLLEEALEDLRL